VLDNGRSGGLTSPKRGIVKHRHRPREASPKRSIAKERHRQAKASPSKHIAQERHRPREALPSKGIAKQRHRPKEGVTKIRRRQEKTYPSGDIDGVIPRCPWLGKTVEGATP